MFSPATLKRGIYIQMSVTPPQFLGAQVQEGQYVRFEPFVTEDTVTGAMRYIIRIKEARNRASDDYYLTFIVPKENIQDVRAVISGTGSYNFLGKVTSLNSKLNYESIAGFVGSAVGNPNLGSADAPSDADIRAIDQVVSPQYAITIINDTEAERQLIYRGIAVFAVALLIFFVVSVEFERKSVDY
jgi:hypothetical protein